MKTEVQIDVQDLDHLGIIAGIVDEIGIVEIIDKEIGTDGTSLSVHGKYHQLEEEKIEHNSSTEVQMDWSSTVCLCDGCSFLS